MTRLSQTWITAMTVTVCGIALCASAKNAAHDTSSATREFVTLHRHAILDEYIQLLKIPNIASDRSDIRRNADAIMAMLQRRGLQPQLLTSSNDPTIPPIVFGQWSVPAARRTIILYAHYDGQPVNPAEWVTAPFTPTLRSAPIEKGGSVISAANTEAAVNPETRLYARSAGDDKLGVMVILEAIDALRATHRTPTDNIKLVFEGEEEAGSPHLADLLTEHKALLDSQLWVVCDGPVHPTGRKLVIYGARGDMNVDVTVYGPIRALHSGHYGNWAPNPAFGLARLLASMKDEKGRILVPGWNDDVAPLGELEQRAIRNAAPTMKRSAASWAWQRRKRTAPWPPQRRSPP